MSVSVVFCVRALPGAWSLDKEFLLLQKPINDLNTTTSNTTKVTLRSFHCLSSSPTNKERKFKRLILWTHPGWWSRDLSHPKQESYLQTNEPSLSLLLGSVLFCVFAFPGPSTQDQEFLALQQLINTLNLTASNHHDSPSEPSTASQALQQTKKVSKINYEALSGIWPPDL